MPRIVVAVVALLIIGGVGSVVLQTAIESGGDKRTIENETFTPASANSVATLDESNRHNVTYYRAQEIRMTNDTGEIMLPGDDYEWIRDNGTVQTLANGGLNSSASANITYGYARPTAEQEAFATILARIPALLGLAAPFLVFVVFLRFIG